ISSRHYIGRVWCPRTANGTWIMRQNGFMTITGNSFMRQNIPATLEQLIEKPGGKVGSAIKGEEALRHDQGFVPDYIGEGLAVPLGKEEDGTQRFLSRFGVMPHEAAFEDLGVGPNAA